MSPTNDLFLKRLKSNITFVLVLCCILEGVFFFSTENLYASFVLLLGWLALATICLTPYSVHRHPVTFLMLFGLALYHYILPLPLTLIEGKPVTFNLRVPMLTFSHHLIFALLITFTHWFYALICARRNVFRNFLRSTIFYAPPSDKVIWITAIAALGSSFYNYFILGLWGLEAVDRDFIFYLTTAFSQFIWAPLLILFPDFRGLKTKPNPKQIFYVSIYIVLLLIIAVTSNWRTVLFSGVFLAFGLFLTGLFMGYYKLSEVAKPKRLLWGAVACAICIGPVLDLAEAMVIVRHERYELSGSDFLKRTIDVFTDKELLAKFKTEKELDGGKLLPVLSYDWNETYLKNNVLNRMVNLKISDNCLFYASEIGYANEYMMQEFKRQIAAMTPNLLLPLLGVSYDEKLESSSYSIGDYLYSVATNRTSELKSWIISAMPGVGMAIFGYWYIPILFVIFVPIFMIFDSFVDVEKGEVRFSYMFFVMFPSVLNYFNDRHVYVHELKWIFRTYPEGVVTILLIYYVARLMSHGLSRSA